MSEEATTKDPMAPYRELFGKPVIVQTAGQVPYLVVGPKLDSLGRPLLIQLSDDTIVGAPEFMGRAENALVGVLRASSCGTWLVLEQLAPIERSGTYHGGKARMDVYLRPEAVAFVTFVKSIEDNEAAPRLLV